MKTDTYAKYYKKKKTVKQGLFLGQFTLRCFTSHEPPLIVTLCSHHALLLCSVFAEDTPNSWFPKENMFSFQTATTTMQA